MHDLVELLDHVHRDADRPRLVCDRARHRLADPPRRVGRKLVALAIVEFLHRANEAERAFLDEVEEREAAPEIALGDRDDQTEIRLDHLALGAHVAALDALCERYLLVGGEQRNFSDLAQVEPQRVERRLDGEIELRRCNDLVVLRHRLLVRRALVLLAFDELDAVLDQVRVEVFDLLLCELDILEPVDDLVIGEESLLLSVRDELLQLLDVRRWRDVDGEHVCDLRLLVVDDGRTRCSSAGGSLLPGLTLRVPRILVTH